MRQSVARLMRMVLNKGGDTRFLEARFRDLFLRHHRNAHEIILNKQGEPLAAIYITPIGDHQESVKCIFKEVRDRMQYAYERDDDEL